MAVVAQGIQYQCRGGIEYMGLPVVRIEDDEFVVVAVQIFPDARDKRPALWAQNVRNLEPPFLRPLSEFQQEVEEIFPALVFSMPKLFISPFLST